MQVHFFSRINTSYRDVFRNYSTLQNLRTVKIISLVNFLLNIALRLIVLIYDIPTEHIKNYQEFNDANILASILNPIFCALSVVLIAQYERGKPKYILSQILVLLYGLFVLFSGMRATFFAMHNPRNTMLMYLIGVVITGAFFTFEFFETILITVAAGICFNLLLPHSRKVPVR